MFTVLFFLRALARPPKRGTSVHHTKAVNELPATVEQRDTNVLTGNSRLRTERSDSKNDARAST